MSSDEFDQVEYPALEQLQSLGWEYLPGDQLSPPHSTQRKSLKEVVLESRLSDSIQRLNPWINQDNLRKVCRDLIQLPTSTLMEANQQVWQTMVQLISVEQDLGKGRKGQTVKVIDFDQPDNNQFLCTNQFKVEGINQNIIPDIILFVNGLPLAVIECKSPYTTNPMQSGINQLLRYANRRDPVDHEGAEKLFHYNQMMISTHRDKARVGTISSGLEHYLEWKDPYPLQVSQLGDNPNSQQVLIAGMLEQNNFLDLIRNFIVFEPEEGRVIKKLARYQQFRSVHKTIHRLKTGPDRKQKGGIIWHTQGSGKSLSMVFLTIKIRRDPDLRDYKLVFITDRRQLHQQLTATFGRVQEETVYDAKSIRDLHQLLHSTTPDLITATVQKFQDRSLLAPNQPVSDFRPNPSSKIVILCDEAHRTQYGTLGAFMNQVLPNAPKIAFTGTPLITTDKTRNEFGTYIDTYTIEQSVADGATVQILYEGRQPQTKVTGDSLDQLFNQYFAGYTNTDKERVKKRYGTQQAILEAPDRIKQICQDIVQHYRSVVQPNGFKAMIVTTSRRAAVTYKEMMDQIDAPESAVIVSGDHNDDKYLLPHTDPQKQKQQIEQFKQPLTESALSFVIVKDMLLTGFDAPICQVMYLDRKLMDHNLLQAIARVNRTRNRKSCGYIVDYYGLSDYLTEALEVFTSEDVKGALLSIEDEIPKLKARHTRCLQHFEGLDLNQTEDCIYLLKDEGKRQQFEIDFKNFCRQMEIVLPHPAANRFLPDLRLLGKICHGAKNRYRDPQLDIAAAGEKVKKLIQQHLETTGVDPKIPPIDLLAKDFKQQVDAHKTSRTRASEIEYAIRDHISVNLEQDPVYYQSLSQRLEEILQHHRDKWDLLEQKLMELRQEMETEREDAATQVGLPAIQMPFYNTLYHSVATSIDQPQLDDQTQQQVIDLIQELVPMIQTACSMVDFFNKDNEIKRVQRDIGRSLKLNGFRDPKLITTVTTEFIELAKVKFS